MRWWRRAPDRTRVYATDATATALESNTRTSSVSVSPPQDAKRDSVLLLVSSRWQRVCWALVVAVNVIAGLFLYFAARLLRFLRAPDVDYYLRLVDASVTSTQLVYFSGIYAALSMVFWLEVARLLLVSLSTKRLSFHRTAASSSEAPMRSKFRRRQATFEPFLRRISRWLQRLSFHLFSDYGLLGIKSVHFSHVQAARKLVQIVSQLYQAARVSRLVSRERINWSLLLIIIFNCVSTPLILKFMQRKLGLLRALCMACDIASGLASAVVIPVSIMLPYYRAWDRAAVGYSDELLYDDVWFITAVMETRLLISTTWIDLVFKVYPFFECLICLNCIKAILRTKDWSVATQRQTHRVSFPVLQRQSRRRFIWALRLRGQQHTRVSEKVHGLFLLAALVAIVMFTLARCFSVNDSVCSVPVHPWFAIKPACAVVRINCYRLHIQGTAVEMASVLATIDSRSIFSFIILHCAELEMPPQVRQLGNLLGIEVYNSTVARWDADAAIDGKSHSSLTFVAIVYSTMASFPTGLAYEPIPSLQDLEISVTNLSSLPEELPRVWPRLANLVVENCQFTEIPRAIKNLTTLTGLSFGGNPLTTIPGDLFDRMTHLTEICFASTGISALPVDLGSKNPLISTIMLAHSELQNLPLAWLSDGSRLSQFSSINIDDTPFCRDIHANVTAVSSEAAVVLSSCQPLATATRSLDDGLMYPLHVTAPNRLR
ncbi:hypothetical protein PINS_up020401 [Pythium insidiosum]|nr:hypothetical protein PINS_up020401 [Pythium insidiosum]